LNKYPKSIGDKFLLLKKDIALNHLKKKSYYFSKKVKHQFYDDDTETSIENLYNWLKNHREVKVLSKEDIILKYLLITIGVIVTLSLIISYYVYDENLSIKDNIIYRYEIMKSFIISYI